jgi:hypothetical protein
MATAFTATHSHVYQQNDSSNNEQTTRVILLGQTGGGMYYYLIYFYIKCQLRSKYKLSNSLSNVSKKYPNILKDF